MNISSGCGTGRLDAPADRNEPTPPHVRCDPVDQEKLLSQGFSQIVAHDADAMRMKVPVLPASNVKSRVVFNGFECPARRSEWAISSTVF